MMSTLYSRLKFVDDRCRNITFGYIRRIEGKLMSKEFEIPINIKNLCLLYYFEAEQFDKHSTRLTVSSSNEHKQNDIVVQSVSGCWYCVYGRVIIDPQKHPSIMYEWTVKYKRDEKSIGTSPSIGIVSTNHTELENNLEYYCFMSYDNDFYCWQTAWKTARRRVDRDNDKQKPIYGDDFGLDCGDVIKMQFDTKNATLRFYKNEKDLGIAHKDINMNNKYQFAMSFANETHSMQLLDFVTK